MLKIVLALLALPLLGAAPPSLAGSVAGVCPDGSAFIVTRKADAPCLRARFVDDPSHMPPLRPELLPRPYLWQIEHEARDPNNPYNLLEAAEKIRAQHGSGAPEAPDSSAPLAATLQQAPVAAGPTEANQPLLLALHQDQIRDLVRMVALRQQVAPATFTVEDIHGEAELYVRLAHSSAFEERVRDALGGADRHVILFSARTAKAAEFYPNFFLVKDGATFRPDPENPHEVGLIVGDPGELDPGYLVFGYLVLPARFDPAGELEIWWNDRSIVSQLHPSR
jgi:hypothetical protein